MDFLVRNFEGDELGQIVLSDFMFGLEPREDILHRVVRWQLAKRRQGTHQAQSRADVSRTGAKMYKQKGMGRARHSSARAPQFRGGGKAHGPVSRSHEHDLPKKVRALGLRHALSAKTRSGGLVLVDDLQVSDHKTKSLSLAFSNLGLKNALLIGGRVLDNNFALAVGNMPHIDILPVQGINVYDILRRDTLVLSREAVKVLEERFK